MIVYDTKGKRAYVIAEFQFGNKGWVIFIHISEKYFGIQTF